MMKFFERCSVLTAFSDVRQYQFFIRFLIQAHKPGMCAGSARDFVKTAGEDIFAAPGALDYSNVNKPS